MKTFPLAVLKHITRASVSSLLLLPCSEVCRVGRTNVKVESLIVERGDGIANDLVGQFADRLAHQVFVGLGYFDAGQTAGELHAQLRGRHRK